MTRDEYDNWRDFATRMAKTCYADHADPEPAEILALVEEFIDDYEDDHESVVDWDRTRDRAEIPCDHMADIESAHVSALGIEWEMHQALEAIENLTPQKEQEIRDAYEDKRHAWVQEHLGPVSCCVRAGLDMATQIGGGVVGFTLGHVRRMYPEGIPAWVQRHYSTPLHTEADDAEIWL